jgi:hypothetical protein
MATGFSNRGRGIREKGRRAEYESEDVARSEGVQDVLSTEDMAAREGEVRVVG